MVANINASFVQDYFADVAADAAEAAANRRHELERERFLADLPQSVVSSLTGHETNDDLFWLIIHQASIEQFLED